MASILRKENKDGTISFKAIVRLYRGGTTVLSESRSFLVMGKGPRAEAATKREAEDWAARLTDAMKDDSAIRARNLRGLTLADLIAKYIVFVEKDKPLGDSKRSALGIVASSRIGAVALVDIKPTDVIAHCRDRRAGGAKPQTINQDIVYLGGVLRRAKAFFDLDVPIEAFELGRDECWSLGLLAKSVERERRLQPGELAAFLVQAEKWKHKGFIPIGDIVRFAIETGMRQGEIIGLLWDDLDEVKKAIVIRDRKDPKEKVGNNQRVPLLGEALAIIQAQPRTDARIFPYTADGVRSRFERLCRLAKIDGLTFHDLRHEAISRLFEQGYQIQEVALVSGHKSWKNLARYTQLKAEDLHRELKKPVAMDGRPDRR
ncbi:site-specific integrase [Chitinibacter sp. GC72]|uniref:integrase n=1 Tax=Chitinibacter sp. GC72 TaxID=1526917 RepID=UPI0012F8127E|nr:site-specific integrase [Chitinibacter sp. GC72]